MRKQLNKEEAMTKATFNETLQEIDDRITDLKNEVELGAALERLHNSDDFKKVLLEAYFEEEEKRLSGLLFNPTKLKRDQIENIMDKATTIRNFKQFFQTMLINAQMAPEQIQDEEGYRKEVTAQGFDVEATDD